MKGLNRLKLNIETLVKRYAELKERNIILEEELSKLRENMDFLENRNQEIPDIVTKNKKLAAEREKMREKIESMIRRMEKAGIE